MNCEEKAKAYDEAIKKFDVILNLNTVKESGTIFADDVRKIFPELKESEDKKIRKELLQIVKESEDSFYMVMTPNKREKLIAWLEKQGEQKPVKWNREDEQNLNACIGYIPDEYLRRWLTDAIHAKYDKPADKVEPKFHEGEWVVYECGEETATLQITRIVGETYVFSDDSTLSVVDEDALRLWDITKDAKDGDVLAEDSCIFIIQKLGDNGTAAKTYCTLYNDGDFDDGSILYFDIDSTKPATKEQRDALERAMINAGYRWNKEELKLEKI